MSGSLRLALVAFLLANLWSLAIGGYNRLGADRGRLMIEECRLEQRPSATGVFDYLLGRGGALALRTASLYRPQEESRPLAERLAALGFSTDPDTALRAPAKAVHVALESDGPVADAVAGRQAAGGSRPLAVRDLDRDPDRLLDRYAEHPGLAVGKGTAHVESAEREVTFRLEPRVRRLALSGADRRYLRHLEPQKPGACRSRFLAEIVYGAAGDPYIDTLRPLERIPR